MAARTATDDLLEEAYEIATDLLFGDSVADLQSAMVTPYAILDKTPDRYGIEIEDVQGAVHRFAIQLSVLTDAGESFPVAVFEERSIPLDLGEITALIADERFRRTLRASHRLRRTDDLRLAMVLGRDANLQVGYVRTDSAYALFKDRLADFLSVRLASRSNRYSGDDLGGLPFHVHTQNSGLRIYYSPAYFLKLNQIFGAPSSPVHGALYPGRYIFGGEGVGVPKRFDPGEYDVPPQTNAWLTSI